MARPPRDINTERLVSFPLLTYSYIIMGITESLVCFGAYLWVFNDAGVESKDIFLLDPKDDLWLTREDGQMDAMSGGNTFTAEQQETIVRQVRAAATRLCARPLPHPLDIHAHPLHQIPSTPIHPFPWVLCQY